MATTPVLSIRHQMPKSGTAFSPQETNLSMGLMYCYMLYVHVMRKPASHLFSFLTETCIQGTSQGAFFFQEWTCDLDTEPSDAWDGRLLELGQMVGRNSCKRRSLNDPRNSNTWKGEMHRRFLRCIPSLLNMPNNGGLYRAGEVLWRLRYYIGIICWWNVGRWH